MKKFIINHFLKDKRFMIFLWVGFINTVFSYSIYALLLFFGVHYALAVLISTIIGILFNFKTTGKIVFKNTKNHLLYKFIGVYVLVYLINTTVIKIIIHLGSNGYIGGVVALFFAVPVSFILNKEFVFVEKR